MISRRRWGSLAASVALTAGLVVGGVPVAHADNDAVVDALNNLLAIQNEAMQVQADLATSESLLAQAQRDLEIAQADLADQQVLVDEMRAQASRVAIADHQRADAISVAGMLLNAEDEQSFLSDIAVMQSVGAITSEQLNRLGAEEQRLSDLQDDLSLAAQTISDEIAWQSELKASYDQKVADAQALVRSLTGDQQQRLSDQASANQVADANAQLSAPYRTSRDFASVDPGASVWPAVGPITSPFGYRVNPIGGYTELHNGVDIGAPCGAPVRAAWTGVVEKAGAESGWGNRIVLAGAGNASLYAHLQSIGVSVGDVVQAGQIIGLVGSTGWSTGCHLHFTTWVNGQLVDPQSLSWS